MNIQEFLVKHPLKIESVKLFGRLDSFSDWSKDANHFQIKISENGNLYPHRKPVFITEYSMGSAIKGKPKLDQVLESLSSDISCARDSFQDFCDNCGYDQDSRKAESIYNACKAIAKDLEAVIGRQTPYSKDLRDILSIMEGEADRHT